MKDDTYWSISAAHVETPFLAFEVVALVLVIRPGWLLETQRILREHARLAL